LKKQIPTKHGNNTSFLGIVGKALVMCTHVGTQTNITVFLTTCMSWYYNLAKKNLLPPPRGEQGATYLMSG